MPSIDISGDYVAFDNTQSVTLTNPDGSGGVVDYALQQGVDTVLADMGDGTLGYRTFCTWNLWRGPVRGANAILFDSDPTSEVMYQAPSLIDPSREIVWDALVPQLNGYVQDISGTKWFISAVNNDVWGNKYQLECESQAGTAVEEVDLPVP
jgi:hypothetical protein